MASISEKKRIEGLLNAHIDLLSKTTSPFKETGKEAARKRYEETVGNTEAFKLTYVPHYVDCESPEFHKDLDAMMRYPEKALFPVHGPREHAKSVHCRINVLEGVLNGRIQFWPFVSETVPKAFQHIDAMFVDLAENYRLKADYDIKILKYDSVKGIFRARVTCKATGRRNHFQLQAISDDTSAKGLLFMQYRPQGALVDDLEKTKDTHNPDNGKMKNEFVRQELYGAVTGPVIWLGNMGKKTSALHQGFAEIYTNEEKFKKFKEQGSVPGLFAKVCVRNGGKLPTSDGLNVQRGFIFRAERTVKGVIQFLWPQRYKPSWYQSERKVMGYRYEGEMNGNPIAPGKIFNNFPTYKPEDLKKFEESKTNAVVFSWCDPAWGRSKHSAYKSYVTLLYDGHYYFILDGYCRQGTAMSELIDFWSDSFEKWAYLGLKDGGYEDAYDQEGRMEDDLEVMEEELDTDLPVRAYKNPGEKYARIESMETLHTKGRFLWPIKLSEDLATIKSQLENYPDSTYVDGPDALEGCKTRCKSRWKKAKVSYQSIQKRRNKRTSRRR